MHGEEDILRSIAVSPDGKTLVVGDFNVGLLFFDARTYERIGEPLRIARRVDSLAYSPDGQTIAVGGPGYIRLIDARTRRRLATAHLGNGGSADDDRSVSSMAFTRDGSRLAVVGASGSDLLSVRLRDATSLAAAGPPLWPDGFAGAYVGSYYQTPGFALTPDGRSVVIASDADELVWWNVRSGTPTRRIKIGAGHHALALSPDARTIAVGVERGIQLVDTKTGAVRMASGALGGAATWLLFSPDGETVASTGLDGTVALWDAGAATLSETLRGHSRAVQQPAFSPDGETLYTVSHDGTAIAWDIEGERGLGRHFTFTHERTADPSGFDGHPGSFSPDGRLLALGLNGEGIRLWDAIELTPAGPPLLETGGEVWALAFSPDGRKLAAVTVQGQATLWDVESRSLVWGPFTVAQGAIVGVSISADGKMLATAGPGGVTLWDMASGDLLDTIGDVGVPAGDVAFSRAGSTLAFVHEHGGDAEVWDVAGRSRIAKLPVGTDFDYYAIALSPDGRAVATGALDDPLVRVWDVHTQKLIRELDQGSAGSLTLDFSADGRTLAVSGFEPVASLWDVGTGVRIGPTLTAGSRRAEIDMSPDGRRLLLTHADGRGAVWDVDPESWTRRACTLANRTLTRAEWEEFLPRALLRAGLRELSPAHGRIDQVKCVSAGGGARPPGRRPRRTSSVGGAASLASRRRAAPRPSRCHLVDSPTTSNPASRLASSIPSSPGATSSGSAEMPTTR